MIYRRRGSPRAEKWRGTGVGRVDQRDAWFEPKVGLDEQTIGVLKWYAGVFPGGVLADVGQLPEAHADSVGVDAGSQQAAAQNQYDRPNVGHESLPIS